MPKLCQEIIPMLLRRKKIPTTISTTGPANERRKRGGLAGGAGGGACTVLAIFHLRVEFASGLSRRSVRGRRRQRRPSGLLATLHQLQDSDYEKNNRPRAAPAGNSPPTFVQILQK